MQCPLSCFCVLQSVAGSLKGADREKESHHSLCPVACKHHACVLAVPPKVSFFGFRIGARHRLLCSSSFWRSIDRPGLAGVGHVLLMPPMDDVWWSLSVI